MLVRVQRTLLYPPFLRVTAALERVVNLETLIKKMQNIP